MSHSQLTGAYWVFYFENVTFKSMSVVQKILVIPKPHYYEFFMIQTAAHAFLSMMNAAQWNTQDKRKYTGQALKLCHLSRQRAINLPQLSALLHFRPHHLWWNSTGVRLVQCAKPEIYARLLQHIQRWLAFLGFNSERQKSAASYVFVGTLVMWNNQHGLGVVQIFLEIALKPSHTDSTIPTLHADAYRPLRASCL